MNRDASEAVQAAWRHLVKSRALCPYTTPEAVGASGYLSPPWYQQRGAVYFVSLAAPLSNADVSELNEIGSFLNRSFVITMAAILEDSGVVPYGCSPDRGLNGGDHAQLTKWLRNRFAHGKWDYDPSDVLHVETRGLLESLFPTAAAQGPGFVLSIDEVLEPLKDGVLKYIAAAS
jgi:hypothetical protein